MKRLFLAAAVAILLSSVSVAQTVDAVITGYAGSNGAKIITATATAVPPGGQTSWVCFMDGDIAISVSGPSEASALATGYYLSALRSPVGPSAGADSNAVTAALQNGMYLIQPALSVRYHEAGVGWWRIAIPSQFSTSHNVSLSGHGC